MNDDIIALYREILLREPTADEIAYWAGQAETSSLDIVEQAIRTSPEGVEVQTVILPVIGLYQGLLGRAPEIEGLEFWKEAISSGEMTFQDLIDSFVGTPEFETVNAGVGDDVTPEELATIFYQNLLGREPDAAGLDFWTDLLAGGDLTPGTFTTAFINTPETMGRLGDAIINYVEDSNDGSIDDPANGGDLGPDDGDEGEEPEEPGGEPGGGGGGGDDTPPTPPDYDVEAGESGALQAAVAAAETGDTIYVGPGIFVEDILIDKDITIVLSGTTVIEGGFAVASNVTNFALEGGSIEGGLKNPVSGVTSASETDIGIYVQGDATISADGVTFVDSSDGPSIMRGALAQTGANASFDISDANFTNLLTGVYFNPGTSADITGSTFTNNVAAIGGVGTGANLAVSGSSFNGNQEDIGIEGNQKLGSFELQGNTNLTLINVYADGGPHDFNVGNIDAQDVVLVGVGTSIDAAIDAAAGGTVLLGEGTHTENVVLQEEVSLRGVSTDAILTASGIVVTLRAGASGAEVSGLTIVHNGGSGSAISSEVGAGIRDVTISNNILAASGEATSGSVVYLNPGTDGFKIINNEFEAPALTSSPLLGIEGNAHLVSGNHFGEHPDNYPAIESFTPNVVIEGNSGLAADDVVFGTYAPAKGGFTLAYVEASLDHVENTSGFITIDTPDADNVRGDALQLGAIGNTTRLRVNEYFDGDGGPEPIKLGDLDAVQFDFYAEPDASRDNVIPVMRLFIDADGDLATNNDRGELVFEAGYNGLLQADQQRGDDLNPVPTGGWYTVDVDGNDAVLWQRGNGQNFDQIANMRSLEEWQGGYAPSDGLSFNSESTVLGFSIGLGSYNRSGIYYADNVAIGSAGDVGTVYLYEFG